MFIPYNPEKLLDIFKDVTIIVEGKKDKKALNSLGLKNIIEISGKTIETLIESLEKNQRYVVLTDFDEEGEKNNKIICEFLRKNKFDFNSRLRQTFKNSFGITQIEELNKLSKLKEDVYHGKISTINYKILNRSGIYREWCSRKTRCDWSNIWSD
jgi:5S rRNA maturation endonuclease (ribonuclease M5)